MCGANSPIGWFEYGLKGTALPLVTRCGIVEKTVGNMLFKTESILLNYYFIFFLISVQSQFYEGDRRLNDHVIVGLEQLLQVQKQLYFITAFLRSCCYNPMEVLRLRLLL